MKLPIWCFLSFREGSNIPVSGNFDIFSLLLDNDKIKCEYTDTDTIIG